MTKTIPAIPKGPVPPPPPRPSYSKSIGRYVTAGLVTCGLLVFGVGGWAATAELNSAVVAGGVLVVSSNVKQVQHPDGGIVGEIHVKNGDFVEPGDLVMRLDETLVKANRTLLDSQLIALSARLARLRAQRDDQTTLALPDELQRRREEPEVRDAIAAEQKVLDARAETIAGQVERLNERIEQLRQQIVGHVAQRDAKQREIDLIAQELAVLEDLFAKGHVPQNRIMALKREKARLEGEHGDLTSRIAIAEGRISETRLEVLQLTKDEREKTFNEITQLVPEIANLIERRTAADFQLARMDIRAPDKGYVHELAVHTVGGVVQPAQTIMQIVPQQDVLVIEARVAPADVDQVRIGQAADVVMSALDHRTTPKLHGFVSSVSADLSHDQATGMSYYTVRVALGDGELERLPSGSELVPGMPAELFIRTGAQTVMTYLLKPLTDQIEKAWRET